MTVVSEPTAVVAAAAPSPQHVAADDLRNAARGEVAERKPWQLE